MSKKQKHRQIPLIPEPQNLARRMQFGGSLMAGKRKAARTISTRDAMHFVLRSRQASGAKKFTNNKNYRRIQDIIRRQSQSFGVKIYRMSVNSNHIHLLVHIGSRRTWSKWLKALSGLIARHVSGAERGQPTATGTSFWDAR